MTNLKKLFYKDYYEGIEINERGKLEGEHNVQHFRDKNEEITNYTLPDAIDVVDTFYSTVKLSQFRLATTNPGLIIGTGYAHEAHNKEEYKLGFFFDHTTGLPILPGSSVKGALRSAFPTFDPIKGDVLTPDLLAKDENGNIKTTEKQKQKARFIQALLPVLDGKTDEQLFTWVHRLEKAIFEGTDVVATLEKKKEQKVRKSRHCVFHDAFIFSPAANRKIVGRDALTPHTNGPLKNPVPLPFLKILPGVTFQFNFSLPEQLAIDDIVLSRDHLLNLFKDILLCLGMGAKTNVGYGQFTEEVPDRNHQAAPGEISQQGSKTIIPSNIPKDQRIEAKLTGIDGEYCVFQFVYDNLDFQFTKRTANITKKWQKKNYHEQPQVNNTYTLRMNHDIIAGQKKPNFTVEVPK